MAAPAIEIRELTRRFGRVVAVDRLTLEIARGELFGLVGPDGAGKTTTLRMLAGILTPTNMPPVVQYVTYLNPLRYFLIVIRGVFLKGNGLDVLWPQVLALFVLGSVVMTVSTLRFRTRLE